MKFPPNPILIHGDSPWTLGSLLILFGLMMIGSFFILMPFVLYWLKAKSRRMSSQEAATLALSGLESGYVKPEAQLHGPAAGMEWHFEVTIGDLRKAWNERRYVYFFGMPAYCGTLFIGAFLTVLGLSFKGGGWPIAGAAVTFLLCVCGILFMMWAAIYTKLE